jgi:adenylosuccinate lyase
MAEVKRILPSLEQEALRWERMANAAERQRMDGSVGVDARIPQLFLKRPEDLKVELAASDDNITKARSTLQIMEREAMAKLLDMRAQVRQLRDQFDEMVENNTMQRCCVSPSSLPLLFSV